MSAAIYKIVNTVKVFLENINADVPFIVAGGSVFSSYQALNDYYSDIDVYFYKPEDFQKVLNCIKKFDAFNNEHNDFDICSISPIINNTSLALTCEGPRKELIQFIKISLGTPEEIFNTFDLNCSKICVTSDYDIIIHKSCSNNIEVDFNNFSASTPSRYLKYIERKGAKDKDNKTLYKIIDYLVDNINDCTKSYYINGTVQIKNILMSFNCITNNEFSQYIHDALCNKYSGTDLLEIFICMYESLIYIKNCSDEYIASRIYVEDYTQNFYGHHNENLFNENRINQVKLKYSEYFI